MCAVEAGLLLLIFNIAIIFVIIIMIIIVIIVIIVIIATIVIVIIVIIIIIIITIIIIIFISFAVSTRQYFDLWYKLQAFYFFEKLKIIFFIANQIQFLTNSKRY